MASRRIEVVEYDPDWPNRFEAAARPLLRLLGDRVVALEHIGSTAVPGLVAKPVIDMLLEVRSLSDLDALAPDIEAIGYDARGENGIAGRRYFIRGGAHRTHHLHAFAQGDPHLNRHRAFRDDLVAHPDIAAAYGRLKLRAAALERNNPTGYSARKAEFVSMQLERALSEAGEQD